jgi:hypothetical protein
MCLYFQDELAEPFQNRPWSCELNLGYNGITDEGCSHLANAHWPMLNFFSIRINVHKPTRENRYSIHIFVNMTMIQDT